MRSTAGVLAFFELLAGLILFAQGFSADSAAKTVLQQLAARQSITAGAVLLVGFGITLAVLSLKAVKKPSA